MAHEWWHWTYDVDPYDLDYAPSQVTDYYYEAPAEQKLDPIPDTSFLFCNAVHALIASMYF